MRALIVAWGLVAGLAALWTGAKQGFALCSMTGLLPPHYGYSAYAVVPLLFLTVGWTRGCTIVVLLLSGNRAAWVGAIAGWAWTQRGGRDGGAKLLLLLALAFAAVLGGLAMKPASVRVRTDSDRVMIWRTVLGVAREHPEGVGPGGFYMGVNGYAISHAHSDVLELAVVWGVRWAALAVLLVAWGFYRAPDGPVKAALVALTVPSIIDNRLTTSWACLALYGALWIAAALETAAHRRADGAGGVVVPNADAGRA